MKRVGNLLKKDLLLGVKDVFIILELTFAVFIVLILLFVMPEDIRTDETVFIYDRSGILLSFMEKYAPEMSEDSGDRFVENREEVMKGMIKNRNALGLIIDLMPNGRFSVELLTQPNTNDRIKEYIDLEMEDLLSILKPPAGAYPPDVLKSVRIESLQEGIRDALPFNKRLMPPIILLMVGVIGLFIMISLVGQERSDMTIRAYRVSPASLWEFIVSKHLTVLITGFGSFSIIYLPMMGFHGYLQSLAIIMLTIVFGSCTGVILGSFFSNPIASALWMLLLLIPLSLPAISLFAPVFSPDWLKIIPSYHTLFALDAAMFPDNNSRIIWQGAAVLGAINVVLFPVSGLVLTRRLGKEA